MKIHSSDGSGGAFTLVELMVSMAILILLLLVIVSITDATRKTWVYTTGKIEQFHDAREAFESVTRKLSQATLNTYWSYDNPNAPTRYQRQSELRFISGPAATLINGVASDTGVITTHATFFQAPLGVVTSGSFTNMESLLNTWGYFVEFGSDRSSWPPFIANLGNPPTQRYRFRLMELTEPSDSLTLYNYTNGKTVYPGAGNYVGTDWFTVPLSLPSRPVHVLAENIIAMVLLPTLSPADRTAKGYTSTSLVASNYLYDSTGNNMPSSNLGDANLDPINQLPPVVQITMVAVDETSYNRYQLTQSGTGMPSPYPSSLFTTAANYSSDLLQLQSSLTGARINYRVFTTNVSMKTAKWSRQQTN